MKFTVPTRNPNLSHEQMKAQIAYDTPLRKKHNQYVNLIFSAFFVSFCALIIFALIKIFS